MIETAVMLDEQMCPIYWHMPAGRTSVSIPDSHELWGKIWTNRKIIHAIAHTHPGSGTPAPSYEDLTTFAAVEDALGKRLAWWIVTSDQVSMSWHTGPTRLEYGRLSVLADARPYEWIAQLRRLGDQ